MRRIPLLPALTVFAWIVSALPAAAQSFRFEPDIASPRGGTTVRVLATGVFCTGCEGTVWIDDQPAGKIVGENNEAATFVAPPHAPGLARVSLIFGNRFYEISREFGYDYEREELLIPIASAKSGAYGTQWVADVVLQNSGDETIPLERKLCRSFLPLHDCGGSNAAVQPHAQQRIEGAEWRQIAPPKDMLLSLAISARVRDASREPEGAGTAIPIVRRQDWRRTPFSLIHVPTDPRYRAWLRVFTYSQSITVRVLSDDGEELDRRTYEHTFPTDSFFFVVDQWADVLAAPRVRAKPFVRIAIEQDSWDRAPTWGMLTLTENATQHVLIYAPQ